MNILNSIYQGNESEMIDYYSQNNATTMEFFLAFSLYKTSKDVSSLNCLKNVANSYGTNSTDDNFKQRFAQLIRSQIGLDPVFFSSMKETTVFKDFLAEYHDSISERVNFWLEKMQSENVTTLNSINLDDLKIIKNVLSEVTPLKNQKIMPELSVSTSYSSDLRIADLKHIHSKEHQSLLEEELFITLYTEFKSKNMPLIDINKFINKTRQIRNEFIEHSGNNKNTISPLFACLHKDIISSILNEPSKELKSFNHENLWTNISQYNVASIVNADIEVIDLPPELNKLFSESKVKQAIWVLKENGEAAFGGRTTLHFAGKHEVHHTDLANGKSVLSAGTILFSEDMTKIIAINPCSGHYRPSVESCLHMKIAMDKTEFDTKDLVICDLNWKPSIFNVPSPNADILASMRKKFLTEDKPVNALNLRVTN